MTWEAFTALSTFFTGVVILATVLLGARQLVQLRKATQLEGIMKIAEQILDPAYQSGLRFVRYELSERLKDADFARDWELGSVLRMDPSRHPEIEVLMKHEMIGAYVKEGLIEGSTVYEMCGSRLVQSWTQLKPLVLRARENTGDWLAWENTEFLSEEAQRWDQARARRGIKT
ncbi:MAG: hypothetical protein NVS1B14_02600 [Vulcanimicrobiaceae bacterium]